MVCWFAFYAVPLVHVVNTLTVPAGSSLGSLVLCFLGLPVWLRTHYTFHGFVPFVRSPRFLHSHTGYILVGYLVAFLLCTLVCLSLGLPVLSFYAFYRFRTFLVAGLLLTFLTFAAPRWLHLRTPAFRTVCVLHRFHAVAFGSVTHTAHARSLHFHARSLVHLAVTVAAHVLQHIPLRSLSQFVYGYGYAHHS